MIREILEAFQDKTLSLLEAEALLESNSVYVVKGELFTDLTTAKVYSVLFGLQDGLSGGSGLEPEPIEKVIDAKSYEAILRGIHKCIQNWPISHQEEFLQKRGLL